MGKPEIEHPEKPDREVHGQEAVAYGPECAMQIEQTLARTIRPHHVGGGGVVDVESLWPDFESKIPYHVLRILHGSRAEMWPERPDRKALCEIVTDGNPILLSEEQYQVVMRVVDKVRRDMVEAMGLQPPWDVETFCRLHRAASKYYDVMRAIPPEKLRVLFLSGPPSGCTWYRSLQPVKWLNKVCGDIIHAEAYPGFDYGMGASYDVIVLPRLADDSLTCRLLALETAGRAFVFEADDWLFGIPEDNPAKPAYDPIRTCRQKELIRRSSACIVSTPELRDLFGTVRGGAGKNVLVCGNGIDPAYWPEDKDAYRSAQDRVRFLWAGSNTHQIDMEPMGPPVMRMLGDYKDRVEFVFVGWWPTWASDAQRRYGSQAVRIFKGCETEYWGFYLAERKADIYWAPLDDCTFNRAKSELKVLEAWALGCAFIGSKVAPYERAVTTGVDGLLASTRNEWESAFRRMMDADYRRKMAKSGQEALVSKGYTMDRVVRQWERALLLAARPLRRRPECSAAVEARLKEIGE